MTRFRSWLSIVTCVLVCVVLTLTVFTQEAPKPVPTVETPKADPAQPIPDEAKRTLLDLASQIGGYTRSIAVLQEKVDASVAEYNRQIAKLQAAAPPGTELSPAWTYVKKPPPKK